jgi:LysM repeat protein
LEIEKSFKGGDMKKNLILTTLFLGAGVLVCSQSVLASTKYVVQKKDSLYAISRRYDVSVKELAAANNIENAHLIKPGQTLIIPNDAGSQSSGKNYYAYMKENGITPETASVQTVTQEPVLLAKNDLPADAGSELTIEEEVVETNRGPEQEPSEPKRYFVGAGFKWWFASLEANAKISANDVIGTEIDLVDDLGVDDSHGIPIINAWIQPFSWLKFQGEYMTAGVEGNRVIDESIVFDGTTFSISDNVTGELDIDRFSGWVEINPFNGSWGYIGLMVGGEYVHLEGNVSSTLVGSASEELDAGTLTVGGQVGFNITEHLDIHARARGMSFEISGVELDVFDIEGGISYTLADHFELSVDYRYLYLEIVEEDENSGDLTLQGPVVGARIKF